MCVPKVPDVLVAQPRAGPRFFDPISFITCLSAQLHKPAWGSLSRAASPSGPASGCRDALAVLAELCELPPHTWNKTGKILDPEALLSHRAGQQHHRWVSLASTEPAEALWRGQSITQGRRDSSGAVAECLNAGSEWSIDEEFLSAWHPLSWVSLSVPMATGWTSSVKPQRPAGCAVWCLRGGVGRCSGTVRLPCSSRYHGWESGAGTCPCMRTGQGFCRGWVDGTAENT